MPPTVVVPPSVRAPVGDVLDVGGFVEVVVVVVLVLWHFATGMQFGTVVVERVDVLVLVDVLAVVVVEVEPGPQ